MDEMCIKFHNMSLESPKMYYTPLLARHSTNL